MAGWVRNRRQCAPRVMSAFWPKADIRSRSRDVCFGPEADMDWVRTSAPPSVQPVDSGRFLCMRVVLIARCLPRCLRRAHQQLANNPRCTSVAFDCMNARPRRTSPRPVRLRVLVAGIAGRSGRGVPRVWRCTEAPGRLRSPAHHHRADTRSSQRRSLIASFRAGSGQQPLRWSAERRASHRKETARRLASACGRTSFARERVPPHPSACRRSAPLVSMRGRWQTSEEQMPREQDEAARTTPPSFRARQARARNRFIGRGV